MFGWIPIIGPIINGISSVFNKYFDTKAVMYKVDGTVDIEAIRASTALAEANQDRIAIRIAQDIVLYPLCFWLTLVTWDNIVLHKYPNLVWTVERFPPGLEWVPYVVFVYLFGAAGLAIWRRK